jgi:hypothetical protein
MRGNGPSKMLKLVLTVFALCSSVLVAQPVSRLEEKLKPSV